MRDILTEARARGLEIPEGDLERIAPVLEAMERSFRPLAAAIPVDVEPAITFECAREEGE